MITKIRCSGCREDLEIVDIITNPLQLVTVEVKPCKNIDCHDCSHCEDLDSMGNENKELKNQLEEIKKIIKHADK